MNTKIIFYFITYKKRLVKKLFQVFEGLRIICFEDGTVKKTAVNRGVVLEIKVLEGGTDLSVASVKVLRHNRFPIQ